MGQIDTLLGVSANLTFEVTAADTAEALLSGDLPVLATPRLIAWAEAATVAVLRDWIPEGLTSVGTRAEVSHLAASPVGANLSVLATLLAGNDRKADFAVEATHFTGSGETGTVMSGRIQRTLVDRERFMSGVARLM